MCVLNREVERSSLTLEAFTHQHRLDQDKIENLSHRVSQLERAVTARDLQLSETEQMVRELQFCTYDGIFVWKISDFSRRRQEAVVNRTPAMFSPGETRRPPPSPVCWRVFRISQFWPRGNAGSPYPHPSEGRFHIPDSRFSPLQRFTPANTDTRCA